MKKKPRLQWVPRASCREPPALMSSRLTWRMLRATGALLLHRRPRQHDDAWETFRLVLDPTISQIREAAAGRASEDVKKPRVKNKTVRMTDPAVAEIRVIEADAVAAVVVEEAGGPTVTPMGAAADAGLDTRAIAMTLAAATPSMRRVAGDDDKDDVSLPV